jgi:limonene-1,2-epoxide hydrolase
VSTDNEKLIMDFCDAWSRRDIDELLSFFTPDAVYHNMPMDPAHGVDQIRGVFGLFVPPSSEIAFEVHRIASNGETVLTERVDRFVMGDKTIELQVAGVFEIRDGKIAAWRDYFDMAAWTSQMA